MKRKSISEINAGSMADIAFLLLIFFLVTTTLDVDQGVFSKIAQENPDHLEIKERNLLSIYINRINEISVNDEITSLDELSQKTLEFIDNGAGKDVKGNSCDWCNGKKLSSSSDHPSKAVITIEADRETSYETYVSVLDKVHLAYNTLRNQLASKMYGKSYSKLEADYKKTHSKTTFDKIELIKSKYPLLIGNIELESSMANK